VEGSDIALVAEYNTGNDRHKNGIGYIDDVGAGHQGEVNRLVKTEYGQSIGHASADNALDTGTIWMLAPDNHGC